MNDESMFLKFDDEFDADKHVIERCTSMSAAVDVGRLAIEVTDRGRAAPKCGVASA